MDFNISNIPILGPSITTNYIPFQTTALMIMLNISIPYTTSPPSISETLDRSTPLKLFSGKGSTTIDPAIWVVWLIFGPIIFVMGVCGNIFVLIIMTRKIMGGTSTCVHLSVMAIADLIVTLIGLTPEWFEICFDAAFKNIHPATCKIEKFFFYSAADLSVWTLAIFTLDRYVAVCHPLKKKSVCTTKRARYFAAIAILVALSKNAHVFWTRGIQYKMDNLTKQFYIRKLCGTSEPSYEYFESYVRSWIVFIFVNGLPAIIISICNFFIAKSMLSTNKRSSSISLAHRPTREMSTVATPMRSLTNTKDNNFMKNKNIFMENQSSGLPLNLSRHSIATPVEQYLQIPGKTSTRYLTQTSHSLPRNKNLQQQSKSLAVSSTQSINSKALVQMTAMCLAASICFLVCNTPSVVLYVGREYWEKNEGYYVFKPLYNIFVYVNHAINFILYCLTGQRFRRIFLDFFCRGRSKKDKSMSRRYSDWGDNNGVNLNLNYRISSPNIARHDSFFEGEVSHLNKARNTMGSRNFVDEIELL